MSHAPQPANRTLPADRPSRSLAYRARRELEKKLGRQQRALARITPKRGASTVAFDEAAALVSRVVTNREQARKLIEHLRRLCE
jgi:hypothetical protein